ncbi:MAG TPA: V-type ATPase 116kDa subunit family protein [Candidatus Acidoferrales bacterium]|nr:V-type ATPase 116kDa subunit family protein [Candidatus Acidoferrales bacterium]
MPSRSSVETVPMSRIAVVGPADQTRGLLVELADAGAVELETSSQGDSSEMLEALRRLRAAGVLESETLLAAEVRKVAELEAQHRADLLAGEVELDRRARAAAKRGSFVVLVGWCPRAEVEELRVRLEPYGGGVVELPRRPFAEPPTLLRTPKAAEPFRPLVEIYGTVRYPDIDPTPFTAVSFVLMFGMMFADAGHGLLLAGAGLYLRFSHNRRWAALKPNWALPFAGGLVATAFGLAYGEFFGPTGLVPVLWLRPLQNPLELLVAGVLVGAVLLAISYAIGTVNRWREGGARDALYSNSGIAGALLFAGVGGVVLGWWAHNPIILIGAMLPIAVGLTLLFIGYLVEAGGGVTGWMEAIVELFNSVIRLGANSISFARLAAFGMVHAAIGSLVWTATAGLIATGLWIAAIPVFVIGNALGFALELVVAGIQALRLEYYELFSRIYSGEGRPFKPWHLKVIKEAS